MRTCSLWQPSSLSGCLLPYGQLLRLQQNKSVNKETVSHKRGGKASHWHQQNPWTGLGGGICKCAWGIFSRPAWQMGTLRQEDQQDRWMAWIPLWRDDTSHCWKEERPGSLQSLSPQTQPAGPPSRLQKSLADHQEICKRLPPSALLSDTVSSCCRQH